MAKEKPSSNGAPKDKNKEFGGAEVEYPVAFQLKAVMDTSSSEDETKKSIAALLGELKIPNSFIGSRTSSKGTYISYHFDVTIADRNQLELMYDSLKRLPGFKFAL